MTFKAGEEHFKVRALAEAKAKVIDLVRQGSTTHQAMVAVGKKPDTVRQWTLRDPKFATDLAAAREESESSSLDALGIEKESIPFHQFSEIFLNQKVFAHHQDWIDLLEGRELRGSTRTLSTSPGIATGCWSMFLRSMPSQP